LSVKNADKSIQFKLGEDTKTIIVIKKNLNVKFYFFFVNVKM
jgi:hypothetical protein